MKSVEAFVRGRVGAAVLWAVMCLCPRGSSLKNQPRALNASRTSGEDVGRGDGGGASMMITPSQSPHEGTQEIR